MRADIMLFTGFGIYQSGKTCLYGTLFYDLPGSMTIDAEKQQLTVTIDGSTAVDVFLEHC